MSTFVKTTSLHQEVVNIKTVPVAVTRLIV